MNAMMVMTFILAPIPGVESSSPVVYAQDSSDSSSDDATTDSGCRDDSDAQSGSSMNGGRGVYKAGCDFNEDRQEVEMDSHYPDGTEGIIEQLIGALFALIGITLFFIPTEKNAQLLRQSLFIKKKKVNVYA